MTIGKLFPEKAADESVVYICRRHRILLIFDELKVILLLAALVALALAIDLNETTKYNLDNFRGLTTALFIAMMIALFVSLYARYYNWKWDLYIITDQRVIDSNRYFPFRKMFSEADLGKVQDSTYTVPILGYFFHYGDIEIQTAGESSNFDWSGIPNPSSAQKILRQTIEEVVLDGRKDI